MNQYLYFYWKKTSIPVSSVPLMPRPILMHQHTKCGHKMHDQPKRYETHTFLTAIMASFLHSHTKLVAQ